MNRLAARILGGMLILFLVLVPAGLYALPNGNAAMAPQGLWLVEDGSAIIELAPCSDMICGRIFWSKDLEMEPPGASRDDLNPRPELRSRPICGLPIIEGLRPESANSWGGGMVYNPEDGQTYGAEMRLGRDGRLRFRGYIALPLFGGTQVWTRPASPPPGCKAPANAVPTAANLP